MPAIGRDRFGEVVADLSQIPRELRRDLRPALKRAGEHVAQDARARASWSRRIPGAISVRVRFGAKTQGVAVVVSRKRAPHARPYEGISGSGRVFRHPLFGRRDRWFAQATRPFLAPAGRVRRAQVRADIAKVVDDAARRHGFH